MVPLFSVESTTNFPNTYSKYHVFSVTKAAKPFESEYTGYYGLGPVEDFDKARRDKWNIAYEMKSRNEIKYLVIALYSCKEKI